MVSFLAFHREVKVIDVVREIADEISLGDGKKLSASQFLQHFLFTPESQHNFVYKLSGGEKRRLHLCTVLMRNPNFLVLDEPTNDLDIMTMNILEDYLQNFKGCVLVVSHDRYFMDKIVDHLLVFEGQGRVKDYPGNYTQYRDWREQKDDEEKQQKKTVKAVAEPVVVKDRPRKLSYKEQKEYEALEFEIEKLEKEKAEVEAQLSSGTRTGPEIEKLSVRFSEIGVQIDEKTFRWMELSELAG